MTQAPEYALVPLASLLPHESVDAADVAGLVREIRGRGFVREPIWVARTERVILNGHHRFAALQVLGVRRVPAWLVEYSDPAMALARWGNGPPLQKAEVIRRARAGDLYPPKTSRHQWRGPDPAPHPTPLAELQTEGPGGGPEPARRAPVDPAVPRYGKAHSPSANRSMTE